MPFEIKVRFYLLSAILLVLSLLSSCKKENETEPLIDFLQPGSLLTVFAGDSVFVEARIAHDKLITLVSVQLLDQNEVPVTSALVYHPNNNDFYISTLYDINNTYLESGIYLLTIYASDGKNSTRLAKELEIQAIPIERKKIIGITSVGNSVELHTLDSGINHSLLASLPGNYLSSSLSSRYQRINILGRSSASFFVLDANNGNVLNQVSTLCPLGDTCFENLQFQNEMNFIAYHDGNIKGFDEYGNQKFMVQQSGYFRPGASFIDNDYFFAELYYTGTREFRLGTFFYPSGTVRQECPLDMDIKSIYKYSQGELLLFGHSNGFAVIEIYNIQTNRSTFLRNLGSFEIHSVYEVQEGEFFLCTTQGIWKYRSDLNQLSQFRPGPATCIIFDPVLNEFFIAEQNNITILDAATLSQKKQYSLPDSVLNVHILYNR